MRHQVQAQQCQGDDERVDQQAHDLDRGLLTATHNGQQAEDQHERQQRPWRRRHVQLVLHEAGNGVGQRHAIDKQDREDGEEVQHGDQRTGLDAEMFLDHLRDIAARAPGKDKTGQPAVGEVGHREGQYGQDQQRPEATQAGIDGQEQGACTDGSAKQAQHPGGVLTCPAAQGCRGRFFIAPFDAWGLLIHSGCSSTRKTATG
ncbi:hypothetical protein D3C76_975800 [compost metagenome]